MSDPRALVPTTFGKRLTQSVVYGLSGGWFSPQAPLLPSQPQTAGRRFDYWAGYNIATRPRRDSGIDFQALRNFAQYYDLLRILLERRKDQITSFEWSITPSDEAVDAGSDRDALNERAAAAQKFLKYPDGRLTWNTWLRSVIEDMLVLDAVVFWPVYEGNQLLRLESIDPATIKLVIADDGRRPEPPLPAYQQILHGIPTADFVKDELFYFMSNPATNRVYGYSKVEQIMITAQIGLRREVSQLEFFTAGNVPAALCGVPDTWNAQQIAMFQSVFDSMLAGDTAARRKMWFVPGDAAKSVHEFKSEDALLKTPFDEWLMRIMCFNIGISPTPFINQVNRATAFTAQEEARDEGLGPTMAFIKDMMDAVIVNMLRLDGIEFKWDLESENDPSTQAQIDDTQLRNGSRTVNELRQRDGEDPVEGGDVALIYTGTGAVPLASIGDITAKSLEPTPAPVVAGAPAAANGAAKPAAKPATPAAKPAAKPKSNAGNVDTTKEKPGQPLNATKQEGGAGSTDPFRGLRAPIRKYKKSTRYYDSAETRYHAARRLAKSRSVANPTADRPRLGPPHLERDS